MLKEGKISVEEADALLEALEEPETAGAPRGAPHGSSQKHDTGSTREETPGFDFSSVGNGLKSGIQEIARSMEGTIKDAVDGIKSLKLGSIMSEAFGRARGTDEKEVILSSDEITAIDLKASSGDVAVTGDDRDDILILAKVTATGSEEESATTRAKEIEVQHETRDGVLTIRDSGMGAQITGPYSVDYTLTVPKSAAVKVRVSDGDISVHSMEGGNDVHTLSGDIHCEECRGKLEVKSKSGDIRFHSCQGTTDARTLSGDIEITELRAGGLNCNTLSGDISAEIVGDDAESIEARTLSGDVTVHLPATSRVSIKADTLSGEVYCDLPVKDVEKKGHRYNAILNEPDGTMVLSTKSGDVYIHDLS